MAVTIRHLVGTRENLDIVIQAHLLTDWNAANTSTITPTIESETLLPQELAGADTQTDINLIRIRVDNRSRAQDEVDEPNGDFSHIWRTSVIIDVWAESKELLSLFEDEINRVLWEARPNAGTRLNKSDGNDPPAVGTNASEVEFFENTELEFEQLTPDSDVDQNPTSSAELIAVWFKLKT